MPGHYSPDGPGVNATVPESAARLPALNYTARTVCENGILDKYRHHRPTPTNPHLKANAGQFPDGGSLS